MEDDGDGTEHVGVEECSKHKYHTRKNILIGIYGINVIATECQNRSIKANSKLTKRREICVEIGAEFTE